MTSKHDTPTPWLDDEDAPVPLGSLRAADPAPAPQPMPISAPEAVELPTLDGVDRDELATALAWVTQAEPSWGWRRLVRYVTGLPIKPSRREAALRRHFAVLYRTAHQLGDQHDRD